MWCPGNILWLIKKWKWLWLMQKSPNASRHSVSSLILLFTVWALISSGQSLSVLVCLPHLGVYDGVALWGLLRRLALEFLIKYKLPGHNFFLVLPRSEYKFLLAACTCQKKKVIYVQAKHNGLWLKCVYVSSCSGNQYFVSKLHSGGKPQSIHLSTINSWHSYSQGVAEWVQWHLCTWHYYYQIVMHFNLDVN